MTGICLLFFGSRFSQSSWSLTHIICLTNVSGLVHITGSWIHRKSVLCLEKLIWSRYERSEPSLRRDKNTSINDRLPEGTISKANFMPTRVYLKFYWISQEFITESDKHIILSVYRLPKVSSFICPGSIVSSSSAVKISANVETNGSSIGDFVFPDLSYCNCLFHMHIKRSHFSSFANNSTYFSELFWCSSLCGQSYPLATHSTSENLLGEYILFCRIGLRV